LAAKDGSAKWIGALGVGHIPQKRGERESCFPRREPQFVAFGAPAGTLLGR
jgi:hypothetical protein